MKWCPKSPLLRVFILVVDANRHPVFFVEIRPPAEIPYDSKREEVDTQMRCRFRDLRQTLAIPILHGMLVVDNL